jgi:hypothetical protein
MPFVRRLLGRGRKSKDKNESNIHSREHSTISSRSGLPTDCADSQPDPETNEPAPLERTEKYGLLEVANPIVCSPRDALKTYYDVDIVAVHGLNGDAYNTWTHKQSQKLWLRDFLPTDVPGARIYSFGYPSEVAFSADTGKLEDWARALLEGLKAARAGKEVF